MHEKSKKQELCKHEYNMPVMTIHGYCGKQCNKCHYIARVKDSVCTVLSEFEKLLEDGYEIEEMRPSEFDGSQKNKQFRSDPHIISKREEIYQRGRKKSTRTKTVSSKLAKSSALQIK